MSLEIFNLTIFLSPLLFDLVKPMVFALKRLGLLLDKKL